MDKENSKKFYEIVGFNFKRKQNNINFLNFSGKRNSQDIIPFSREIIRSFYCKEMRKLKVFKGKRKVDFSRKLLLKIKNELKSLELFYLNEFLDTNVQEDMKWFSIKEVIKSENDVFDFSLDHIENDNWCHSVLYNGFVGHQTPKGLNHFYEFWMKACRKENANNFYPIAVGWWEVPGRDEEWKKEVISDIGTIRFSQEYQCLKSNSIINIKDMNTNLIKKVKIGDLFKHKKYK
jgi:hypothetical protein